MLVGVVGALGAHESESVAGRVNPIRRVVTLLQNMQTKVTEEGKKEKELFEAFMCFPRPRGALTAWLGSAP